MFVRFNDMNRAVNDMNRLQRHLEALFDGAWGLDGTHGLTNGVRTPDIQWEEKEDAYLLTVGIPGLSPDAIEATATGHTLNLAFKREIEAPEGYTVLRRERRPWVLSRTLKLPQDADVAQISATVTNGVLTLSVPKRTQETRTIEIKAG